MPYNFETINPISILFWNLLTYFNHRFQKCRRRTFHVPHLMRMNLNKEFRSLTLGSAHEKFESRKLTDATSSF